MPIVEAHVLEGYTPDDKRRLVRALTDAVRFVVPAPDEAITVMLHDYPAENYGRGGQMRQPAAALPDPGTIVLDYLAAMEARALDRAQAMLGDGFVMTFPGTGPMMSLADLIDWSKGRYRVVTKTYEAVEAFHANGTAVVYTRGTLAGEWPDGTPFEGIRFIDRFELAGGKITRQDVWNDMGEVRRA
jgi:4-oxalocrotonate tautomerase family enzyme